MGVGDDGWKMGRTALINEMEKGLAVYVTVLVTRPEVDKYARPW